MMTPADIKSYLRDLVYLEEDIMAILKKTELNANKKKRLFDNLTEKQVTIAKIIGYLSEPDNKSS